MSARAERTGLVETGTDWRSEILILGAGFLVGGLSTIAKAESPWLKLAGVGVAAIGVKFLHSVYQDFDKSERQNYLASIGR